ncbi:MAG: PKD domain-containing protein [Bacteroidetes bacterium]|nr:PKD domain-containing protein [Bacteroidota bacterium]
MKRILTAMALLSVANVKISAQFHHEHSCGTELLYQQMLKDDPSLAAKREAYSQEARAAAKNPTRRAAKYTIPVVFHVIHTNGSENISREQILDQMRILNLDFNFLNANKSKIRSQFTAVAADCQIEFKLANIDPNGKCTDGINRVYSPFGVEVDQANAKVKSLVRWDYTKYLNIWVVTSIGSSGSGITLGYAVFPFATTALVDGIVVRHDRVGTIGTAVSSDSGRTLTHEIGHWLGLFHTFQGGCNSQDNCDDTPPVASTFTNANCPANGNSCSTDNPNLPDQWENYMDYSDGNCMAMFTLQQKAIMHSYLNKAPRSSNVSAANLLATGITPNTATPPTAAFSSSNRIVCAGEPVTYYDMSCKATVTARSWTLTGSSSPSSSSESPVVVYQTPGKYAVSLTVQNAKGSNTSTVTDYIEVVGQDAAQYPNAEEKFESDPVSRGYLHLSPSGSRWTLAETVAYTGSKSYQANISSSTTAGTVFSFRTPSYDLSKLGKLGLPARLSFYAAYALPTADVAASEILRVYVSTDCGNSYRQILERSGTGLAYSGGTSKPAFVPANSSQWKLINIPSFSQLGRLDTAKNAIFRIDIVSNAGNSVWIDDINVSQWFSGTHVMETDEVKAAIYPNPARGNATLELNLTSGLPVTIDILDVQGRVIQTISKNFMPVGKSMITLGNPAVDNGTIYLVRIQTRNGFITKPITFAP